MTSIGHKKRDDIMSFSQLINNVLLATMSFSQLIIMGHLGDSCEARLYMLVTLLAYGVP